MAPVALRAPSAVRGLQARPVRGARGGRAGAAPARPRAESASDLLWLPSRGGIEGHKLATTMAAPAASSPGGGGGYNEHKPKTPPPDLPSLLLDSRIIYLGMPLVPAVTELIIAELLYLQYTDATKPFYIYINSTGCSRADGEVVGHETEATAIYDTMKYVGNEIYTVGTGVAVGQACMLLSAGTKGKRFMMPHATAMLHQPRTPPSGSRQATEIYIKWKEVLAQKTVYQDILAETTGQPVDKLDKDMQRPLYMQPKDAMAYGIIDKVLSKDEQAIDEVKGGDIWDKEAGLVARPAPSQ